MSRERPRDQVLHPLRGREDGISRRVWFLAIAVVGASIAFAVAAEAVLRLAGYDPLGGAMEGRGAFVRASQDSAQAYELVPGATGRQWGSEVAINSHGFRDREYDVAKPPGTRRVAVIGDSITFGFQLSAEETYPKRLEATLSDEGLPVEVLNFGVGGYDTLNEVASFERTGVRFDPDVVVLGFCINDVGTQSVNLSFVRILEAYGPWIRRSRLLQLLGANVERVQQEILARASVNESEEEFRAANFGRVAPLGSDPRLRALLRRLRRIRDDRTAPSSHPFLAWYRSEARVGKLRYGFDRLSRLAAERGIPVVFVLIPLLDEEGHEDAYRLVYDIVLHEAARAGFVVVDARAAFADRGTGGLALVLDGRSDPIHPNAEGNRRLAAQLAPVIRDLLARGESAAHAGAAREIGSPTVSAL